MNKSLFLTLLLIMSLAGHAKSIISPADFEQFWFHNNQRNLFKRYYYYNDQIEHGLDSLYLIGADAAPDVKIRTSEGVKDALMGRLNIHYQSRKYLFLIDWFSVIPQPQETEGFTYGDLILGHTWQFKSNNSYFTLGLRQKSIPRTVMLNSETVFEVTSDATKEDYSGFFHFNYHGFDLGTYYSENNQLEAVAFHMPITATGSHTLSSTIAYYGEIPDINLNTRYEVSLDHIFEQSEHNLRSGMTCSLLPGSNEYGVSNIYSNYTSPSLYDISLIAGLYFYRDIENDENFPGARVGLVWQTGSQENNIRISFAVQQNAVGDIYALIIPDEPIMVFTLSSGLEY